MYVNTPVIMHCECFFTLTSVNVESKDPAWIIDFDQTTRQTTKTQNSYAFKFQKPSNYIVFTYLGNQ